MKRYEALLFDLDDTLLDFGACEHEAMSELFRQLGEPLDDGIRALYREINRELWHAYEQGSMAREAVLDTRFGILFERLGRTVDGVRAEAIYREALGRGSQLMDGALEVCAALGARYPLHIATNGFLATQLQRLESSGLGALVQRVFVSEEIGAAKPSKVFFDHVCGALGVPPERLLVIGDSLTSDMQGGVNAGMDTCWFNPGGAPNTSGLPLTYEVRALRELLPLLLQDPVPAAR